MATGVRPLIRLSTRTYARLKALSKKMKRPMSKIAEEAIHRYDDDQFWDAVDRAYESWTPEQKAAYHREFKEWEEATIADGLEPEDWMVSTSAGSGLSSSVP